MFGLADVDGLNIYTQVCIWLGFRPLMEVWLSTVYQVKYMWCLKLGSSSKEIDVHRKKNMTMLWFWWKEFKVAGQLIEPSVDVKSSDFLF